jgi:hypothetical protein
MREEVPFAVKESSWICFETEGSWFDEHEERLIKAMIRVSPVNIQSAKTDAVIAFRCNNRGWYQ